MILKRINLCLLGLLISSFGFSQTALSPRIANYDIQVELDVANKKLYGKQTLLWQNPSTDTIFELQYHLYLNAFKNSESTFLRERSNFSLLDTDQQECVWSWVDVQKITDEYGNDLTGNMAYIQLDDGNENDQTVLRVPLTKPVLPGGSIKVNLDWVTKIPKVMPRTGYNKDYYFMVQWFPKVGVYEPAGMRYATTGQWNCHQYFSNGEYYSDFGNYKVDITVPKNYIVGASGSLKNEMTSGEKKTYTYQIDDVIDFAWTASPHYIEKTTKWKNVDIRLLSYPDHEHFAERYFVAVKNAFEYLDQYVGEYPYSTLTIIDPPIHGIFTSGMEYPTLITTLSACFLPKGIKTTEIIVVHEFIHQYFMQMVATNEQEEPWMDEGITTYYEGKIMDNYYGEKTSTIDFFGIRVGNTEANRAGFFSIANPKIGDNSYFARDFKHGGYGPISYNKTALWLETLEGIVGINTMDKIMKTYFERWKFKHPCGRDFIEVVNDVVKQEKGNRFGENMNWYFDQVLYGSELCDYKIAAISHQKIKKRTGFFDDLENCEFAQDSDDQQPDYEAKVILHRLGEVKLPIEILVQFDDGSTITEHWNGMARSTEFVYTGKKKIEYAEIDP
ncbi:MAG: hypothetical protein ACI8P3_004134, partial [Saprospiraceae bacterium]